MHRETHRYRNLFLASLLIAQSFLGVACVGQAPQPTPPLGTLDSRQPVLVTPSGQGSCFELNWQLNHQAVPDLTDHNSAEFSHITQSFIPLVITAEGFSSFFADKISPYWKESLPHETHPNTVAAIQRRFGSILLDGKTPGRWYSRSVVGSPAGVDTSVLTAFENQTRTLLEGGLNRGYTIKGYIFPGVDSFDPTVPKVVLWIEDQTGKQFVIKTGSPISIRQNLDAFDLLAKRNVPVPRATMFSSIGSGQQGNIAVLVSELMTDPQGNPAMTFSDYLATVPGKQVAGKTIPQLPPSIRSSLLQIYQAQIDVMRSTADRSGWTTTQIIADLYPDNLVVLFDASNQPYLAVVDGDAIVTYVTGRTTSGVLTSNKKVLLLDYGIEPPPSDAIFGEPASYQYSTQLKPGETTQVRVVNPDGVEELHPFTNRTNSTLPVPAMTTVDGWTRFNNVVSILGVVAGGTTLGNEFFARVLGGYNITYAGTMPQIYEPGLRLLSPETTYPLKDQERETLFTYYQNMTEFATDPSEYQAYVTLSLDLDQLRNVLYGRQTLTDIRTGALAEDDPINPYKSVLQIQPEMPTLTGMPSYTAPLLMWTCFEAGNQGVDMPMFTLVQPMVTDDGSLSLVQRDIHLNGQNAMTMERLNALDDKIYHTVVDVYDDKILTAKGHLMTEEEKRNYVIAQLTALGQSDSNFFITVDMSEKHALYFGTLVIDAQGKPQVVIRTVPADSHLRYLTRITTYEQKQGPGALMGETDVRPVLYLTPNNQ